MKRRHENKNNNKKNNIKKYTTGKQIKENKLTKSEYKKLAKLRQHYIKKIKKENEKT